MSTDAWKPAPRYEVRRPDGFEFILWDRLTNSKVEFVGPFDSASDATRRCGYHNRAWQQQKEEPKP